MSNYHRYRSRLEESHLLLEKKLREYRDLIPHPGEKGTLVEQAVREELENFLPETVGVSHGFVVDSSNEISKQMDIIIYDKLRTPRIFVSRGAQMFPVEATYACGEVKTRLDRSAIADCIEKSSSYKSLSRNVLPDYVSWESVFFVLALESNTELGKLCADLKAVEEHRIDSIFTLESAGKSNCLINVDKISNPDIVSYKIIDEASLMATYNAKSAWVLFIASFINTFTTSHVTTLPPFRIADYVGDDPL